MPPGIFSFCRIPRPACLLFGLLPVATLCQPVQRLNIHAAYELARANYPQTRQRDLIRQTGIYSVANAAKGWLPALSFSGQATYQSEVTQLPFKIPIAGFTLPQYSRDQYKIVAELDQTIYDGGQIRNQKQTAALNSSLQEKNLDVDLYALYDRVNQLFFGVLLMDAELEQNDLLRKDIQNGLDLTQAQLANGTAYRSSVEELQAQILSTDQGRLQEEATRKAYLDMLGWFINRSLDSGSVLEWPPAPDMADSIRRPELAYYGILRRGYDLQDQQLSAELRPRFSFFVQGGYGRPGLNFLNNDFAFWYYGGLRLSWNLGSWYSLKGQREILNLNRRGTDIQKETFLFNTQLSRLQQADQIANYRELVRTDDQIVDLRNSVKHSARAQLQNGVLSAHDYITQVNAEDQARQQKILHQVQLLQAEYSYQNSTGIP